MNLVYVLVIYKLFPKILCIEYDILMWKNSPVYTVFHTLEIAHVQSFVQSVFFFCVCCSTSSIQGHLRLVSAVWVTGYILIFFRQPQTRFQTHSSFQPDYSGGCYVLKCLGACDCTEKRSKSLEPHIHTFKVMLTKANSHELCKTETIVLSWAIQTANMRS